MRFCSDIYHKYVRVVYVESSILWNHFYRDTGYFNMQTKRKDNTQDSFLLVSAFLNIAPRKQTNNVTVDQYTFPAPQGIVQSTSWNGWKLSPVILSVYCYYEPTCL